MRNRLVVRQFMLVGVLSTMAVIGAGISSMALTSGVALWHFVGKVTDPLGNPIAGATVSDGGQQVTTATDGSYSLGENGAGTYDLTAMAFGHAQQGQQVTVLAPGDTTVNFALPYVIAGQLSRYTISTATGPASASLSIMTFAPVSGTCVQVTDAGGTTSEAIYAGPGKYSGSSAWTWTLTVPQQTAEGEYDLAFAAVDCARQSVISTTGSAQYSVDNTAPVISAPGPRGWASATPLIHVTASDANLDVSSATITLDGHWVPVAYQSTGSSQTSTYVFSYQVPTDAPLAAGSHSVTFEAPDTAGNVSQLTWSFTVDNLPPVVSDAQPTGTIASRTPGLSARLADSSSGVDASTITMTLSNGVLSRKVAAIYDPSTGVVSYQIPSTPTGAGLGQFPLLDGTYQVTVSVADIAGNHTQYSWAFSVNTLPPGA
ncbi:MAG: Ig-like domain repeat protein [Acidimicrobiales bacterium]